MPTLSLKIVTPERIVYEDEVDSVTVPTETGDVTVLQNHVPLMSVLQAGEIRTKTDGAETSLAVSTGFLEVRPGNHVIILADTAERADELDVQQIEAAQEAAKKLLEEKRNMDQEAFAAAVAALEREMARYKVAMKRSRGRTTFRSQ